MTPPPPAMMKALCPYLLLILLGSCSAQMMERDRIGVYRERNYSWPPEFDEYVPSTAGWAELQARRFEQVRRICSTNKEN